MSTLSQPTKGYVLAAIDLILDRYERDLKRANEGRCQKVSERVAFRNSFRQTYVDIYKPLLEQVVEKLTQKGHSAEIEESPRDFFFRFALVLVPRHLRQLSFDKYYPNSLWSSISFTLNEQRLSIDVHRILRPNIEGEEKLSIVTFAGDQFNEQHLMDEIGGFLRMVFDETIVLDFRTVSGEMVDGCKGSF